MEWSWDISNGKATHRSFLLWYGEEPLKEKYSVPLINCKGHHVTLLGP
jgi:hypothetical protein